MAYQYKETYSQRVIKAVPCPDPNCKGGAIGQWCRNDEGKCIPTHKARMDAALKKSMAAYMPLTERRRA
jgi:hypothetical protein